MITLGVLAGDGVGPEVIAESLGVLSAIGRIEGFVYDLRPFDLGGNRYLRTGEVLPAAAVRDLHECDAILLGAVGHPEVAPGVLERGILLKLRFDFHQYINLRPVQLFPGVEGPIRGKGPDQIDMVVVRENNEDLYVGAGGFCAREHPKRSRFRHRSTPGPEWSAPFRFAFETARSRSAFGPFRGLSAGEARQGLVRQVTLVAKTNVLTFAHDLWMRAFGEISREYADIKCDYQHVDACCMRMVQSPERFDVIVTTNMFGDIITDLGAVISGGLGLAASGNINPERTSPSMFEPVHGSAPDIAGKGIANPLAAILSLAMMLDHLDQPRAANRVRQAVRQVLSQPGPRTPDLGGTAATKEVGEAVCAALVS